ncbi:hypothetical protein [Pendulispora albinea]|uniref:Dolichyl-phosphate-mannose-protein mannosyltransferase n=1 Tax=Pendulispora albinea TaxID=2741071 RepID=A0ABZ2M6M9_9BACT
MTFLETFTGAWGFLPVAVPACIFVAIRIGALVFPESAAHRAVGGPLLTLALIVATVGLAGVVHLVSFGVFALLLAIAAVGLGLLRRDRRLDIPLRTVLSRDTVPLLVVAGAALGIAILVARWLPIWQWDSLGYHLPYVNFVLVGRGLDAVPTHIPYLSSYPHNVDRFMVALRAMLPDDRLVDLAQVPLAIPGAAATAGIARLAGAERAHAVAAGAAWILVPATFLELPTNYIDVGCAAFFLSAIYFVLAPPTRATLMTAGIALGLYLGSKANAPVAASILGLVLLVRGVRAKLGAAALLALAAALAFGADTYITNWIHYGNPVWPVNVVLGPLHLPGTLSANDLLGGGPLVIRAHGILPWRLLSSWAALAAPPVHDMRLGGYGPIFLVALPFAVLILVRARSVALGVALAATLASPAPEVARYVLAFPAMVLALAAPHLARLAPRPRSLVFAGAAALGIAQIVYAWPGLFAGGPPLRAYASMSDDERRMAIGVGGPVAPYLEAQRRVGPGETYAFAIGDDLLYYLAWDGQLTYPVVAIGEQASGERIDEVLAREHVRVVMTRDDSAVGRWAQAHPERFERLFSFRTGPGSVYERR